jgi:hypothetical protein
MKRHMKASGNGHTALQGAQERRHSPLPNVLNAPMGNRRTTLETPERPSGTGRATTADLRATLRPGRLQDIVEPLQQVIEQIAHTIGRAVIESLHSQLSDELAETIKRANTTVPQQIQRIPIKEAGPPKRLWKADVCRIVGVTPRAITNWIASGKFPAPDGKIGYRSFWLQSTMESWEADARAGRYGQRHKWSQDNNDTRL